ncbi:C1 family peptidase [Mesorhizobium sp. BR1-1-16]|uniref:C1 family peptidase n=1 Tax=Mesorhizobium sp. BR1-1-16 TaxID=2876653 RepID=UPI001CCB24C8|nr:C1 family peptidase [Mesorhizobium sp. BR1-1-16]MBZ9937493.1 C1 family peptidase [Mesorhizobium sp. BR1-1-16]
MARKSVSKTKSPKPEPSARKSKPGGDGKPQRTFDALPDTLDFRDQIFVPTLIRVGAVSDLASYRAFGLPVLNQGSEGACTGFGLASVANFLLRLRGSATTADKVSAWMLYAMAKRYDEWPGEDYSGSSARGAMKGWFKHGLCAYDLWNERDPDPTLEEKRAADALGRPLGAYFRVNHKDLVAMHSAITEAGILYATARVHEGWQAVRSGDEVIEYREGSIGGHAFAIVGYDRQGLWIQNSWGEGWGAGGLARLSYADWLKNGTDVWVAALGAPIDLVGPGSSATMRGSAPRSYQSKVFADLRPHIVTAKNDGILDDKGTYGLTEDGLKTLITERMTATMADWPKKRVLLYAHGGLVSANSAIQTVSSNLGPLMDAKIYPISFIWRSDAWSTISNILREAIGQRRDEGLLDKAKDFMLDRFDDTIEVVARNLGGKAMWDEMKENAIDATTKAKGAARLTADHLVKLSAKGKIDEIHLVGHSAGSIFHAELARYLASKNVVIDSVSLWAPACTMDVFDTIYRPLAEQGSIRKFDLYTLDDATEQDDNCANIYNKSLLYLVSNAFEKTARIPGIRPDGQPMLGMEHFASRIPAAFWVKGRRTWTLSPGSSSKALHHGDFDNDAATRESTLARIVGDAASSAALQVPGAAATASSTDRQRFRKVLNTALRLDRPTT